MEIAEAQEQLPGGTRSLKQFTTDHSQHAQNTIWSLALPDTS
jgi:hypothetical protein